MVHNNSKMKGGATTEGNSLLTSQSQPSLMFLLETELSQNWKRFKRHWDNCIVASRLSEEDQNFQCAVFLATVGEDALDIFDGLKFDSDAYRKNLETVMQKFEQFCVGQTHEAYESYKFHLKKKNKSREKRLRPM